MKTQDTKHPSSEFAQAALALDSDFATFERLARELERLSVDSDKGLEKAQALLSQFEPYSQRIGADMESLARSLDEARNRAEKAAQIITERAVQVQERQQQVASMHERFRMLGDMVRQVTAAVAQIRQPAPAQAEELLTDEDQQQLISSMTTFNTKMTNLVEEARQLMDDANGANMKVMARNADSLRQSLQAAQHRLNLFVERRCQHPLTTH